MNFQWPGAFLLLGFIPLLALAYFLRQRRRRKYAVRFSSLTLVRSAVPAQSTIRRYLPLGLFFLAFATLVIGVARPVATVLVPEGRATVVMALDVSGSMRQTDILPSRLGAAKNAALAFIDRQQGDIQIGVVAFAGIAQLVQEPSIDAEELKESIQHLTIGRGTAIGSGIIAPLETISEFNQGGDSGPSSQPPPSTQEAAPPAELAPDIIVLLTDGVYTTGPNPLDAAQEAVNRGIRVYTIGFGTRAGSAPQGEDFFGGRRFRRGIDEDTLKAIAAMTGGEYYSANSADELIKVFDSLPTILKTREDTIEITVFFAAIAALLVIAAVLLAQLWHPLP